jgi:hypothetical protein
LSKIRVTFGIIRRDKHYNLKKIYVRELLMVAAVRQNSKGCNSTTWFRFSSISKRNSKEVLSNEQRQYFHNGNGSRIARGLITLVLPPAVNSKRLRREPT